MTSNTDERCCTSLDDTPMHHADGGAAPRARASAIRAHSLTPRARARARASGARCGAGKLFT